MSETQAAETQPTLSRVTALLSFGPGQPAGDLAHGLELLLGLTPDARIDPDAYLADPRDWSARRFRPDRPDWHGVLVREEGDWTLRGDPASDGPLWLLEVRTLHPGDYLTLRRPDGEELVFRVVGVAPADYPAD
jgi:hypothetical protein